MKKYIILSLILLLWAFPVLGSSNTHSIDLERDDSQYLSAVDSASLSITGDITIEMWFKLETTPSSAAAIYVLVMKVNGADDSFDYYMHIEDTDKVWVGFKDSDGNSSQAYADTQTFDADTWYHLAAVMDVSVPDILLYVDASSIDRTMSNSATAPTSIVDGTGDLNIGRGSTAATRYFDGLIDEVRIWNDIRTATEISDNYQTELVGNEAGLAAYWQLDDSLLDETSNDNDLTNNNSAVFSTIVPFAGTSAAIPQSDIW